MILSLANGPCKAAAHPDATTPTILPLAHPAFTPTKAPGSHPVEASPLPQGFVPLLLVGEDCLFLRLDCGRWADGGSGTVGKCQALPRQQLTHHQRQSQHHNGRPRGQSAIVVMGLPNRAERASAALVHALFLSASSNILAVHERGDWTPRLEVNHARARRVSKKASIPARLPLLTLRRSRSNARWILVTRPSGNGLTGQSGEIASPEGGNGR